MTVLLIDHNLEGQALLLFASLRALGRADLLDIRLAHFKDARLPLSSTDRDVWRHVQSLRMVLLTANRSMNEVNSLEQTIREENTPLSLPVVTVANARRLADPEYRGVCADRLAEIIFDLD